MRSGRPSEPASVSVRVACMIDRPAECPPQSSVCWFRNLPALRVAADRDHRGQPCPFRSSMSLASKGAGPQRVPVTSAKVPRPPPLRPARASRRRFATSLAEMASAGDGFRHHEAAGRKATPLTTVSFERKSPGCSRVARSGAILPESEAELREVAASVAAPTLANMVETGRTPHLSAERLGGRDLSGNRVRRRDPCGARRADPAPARWPA